MPTFSLKYFFLFIFVWLLIILAPPMARASTDPQNSTSSATATVPRTTPTTGDTTAPSSPILIRPVDGTITGDNRPELVWHYSTDDNSNTVRYTLYLNDVATYLGVSDEGNSSGAGYTARIETGDIRLLPTTGLPDGTYAWRVDAYDLSGNTSHSTTWHFTIDTKAPPLELVDLDIYHLPVIEEGANFDIAGPKDIYFTVQSDPFVTIQLLGLSATTNSSGLATLYQHLDPGVYSVSVVAIDRAGITAALPTFTLTITQAALTLEVPGLPPYSLPYSPFTMVFLPATIAKLETPAGLSSLIIVLLAICIILLLIILWRRRYNLLILDAHGQPIHHATVYHSNPGSHTLYSIHHTVYYRLYIPHLTRYSTLTIRTQDAAVCTTTILSLSVKRSLYTIVLG